ncbi:MAG: hypothetical protein V9G98_10670 [Candidatus Competibacter sp.]
MLAKLDRQVAVRDLLGQYRHLGRLAADRPADHSYQQPGQQNAQQHRAAR